ncbi:MAG: hypothetical protein B6I18_02025 [Bacteroidetes bacterium 4572_112]|nr:MAG: hypothetical protein B6I18_02025 [Bacteroidetes bacterium 4572_112]
MYNKYSKYILIILLIIVQLSSTLFAQKKQSAFIDSTDNALDISHYLYNLHGLLPIISPITEPAVGFGAAAVGVFFIPKKDDGSHKFKMPDIVGIGGGYTENTTWFVGGGYIGFWNNDKIRYRGVTGYGDVKLRYYKDDGYITGYLNFRLQSFLILQQALFRIGNSGFMIGGKYQFSKTTVGFYENIPIPDIKIEDLEMNNSGIAIITEYENYDNIFSPSKGLRANITYDQYLEVLGGDRNFGLLSAFVHNYYPVIKDRWTAGIRFESKLSVGEVPFYKNPFVHLRGVAAMRYQGELTALIETEQELMLSKRWSIVGFGGFGKAYSSLDDLSKNVNAWNVGTGFRYLIARQFGLKMGLDIARGPEQYAIYIVFGNSWLK